MCSSYPSLKGKNLPSHCDQKKLKCSSFWLGFFCLWLFNLAW